LKIFKTDMEELSVVCFIYHVFFLWISSMGGLAEVIGFVFLLPSLALFGIPFFYGIIGSFIVIVLPLRLLGADIGKIV